MKATGKPAPKARNMTARGKREARRPWVTELKAPVALKGRNARDISAFQALIGSWCSQPGAPRFALAPGFHISRLWRSH